MAIIRIPRPEKSGTTQNSTQRTHARASGEPPERVGYRNPPRATRYQKGQSGNPKGRPRRGNFWADLFKELDRPVLVTEGGKNTRMTAQQVAIRRIVSEALRGNTKAMTMLLQAMHRIEEPKQPELEKGKFYDYLRDKLGDIIYAQRKAGYDERVAEERNPRKPEDFWKKDASETPEPSSDASDGLKPPIHKNKGQ